MRVWGGAGSEPAACSEPAWGQQGLLVPAPRPVDPLYGAGPCAPRSRAGRRSTEDTERFRAWAVRPGVRGSDRALGAMAPPLLRLVGVAASSHTRGWVDTPFPARTAGWTSFAIFFLVAMMLH